MVLCTQSTIDFQRNWGKAAEARRSGQRWTRPPHPTARQNLQARPVPVNPVDPRHLGNP